MVYFVCSCANFWSEHAALLYRLCPTKINKKELIDFKLPFNIPPSQDGIIPILQPLSVQSSRGEPVRALAVTLSLCEVAVLIGNVDAIAPLLR